MGSHNSLLDRQTESVTGQFSTLALLGQKSVLLPAPNGSFVYHFVRNSDIGLIHQDKAHAITYTDLPRASERKAVHFVHFVRNSWLAVTKA